MFKVYDLICRRFIACCSEDAIIDEGTVEVEVNGESFHVKGVTVVEPNFLEIYKKFYYLKEKDLPGFN